MLAIVLTLLPQRTAFRTDGINKIRWHARSAKTMLGEFCRYRQIEMRPLGEAKGAHAEICLDACAQDARAPKTLTLPWPLL